MNFIAKKVDDLLGKVPVAETSPTPWRSDTEFMRAITWQGKQSVTVERVGKPLLTHPGDVIIKVTAFTVCSGSDGHIYAGEIPTTDKGFTIGHEAMGIVESKGDQVTKFNVGDRVVIAFDIACGTCDYCRREEYTGCDATNDSKLCEEAYGHRHAAMFGYTRLLGNVAGSQAEFVRVPFADVNCYPIPDDVPDEKALFLSDVLCTSLHAVTIGEVKKGDTVVIWGLGPIGLYTARWAQIKGARRVVGIDMVPERLALAQRAFNIEIIDRTGMSSQQLTDTVLERVPGGADVVVEAVGFRFPVTTKHKIERAIGLETDTADILSECFTCVRKWGHVSIIADYSGYANHFPIGHIMMKHLTVRSGQCPCQRYFKTVMDHVQSGEIDPTYMVTHRITMEEVPLAYEKLHYKQDGYIKVFVRP